MNKKILIRFILFFNLILLFSVKVAMAANCGDTNSDGTTETVCACGDTVIGASGYTYQLTENLGPCSANGLVVGSASTTIDGNNHTITGSGAKNSYGIYNNAIDNVTIKNLTVTSFYNGVYFSGSANSGTIDHVTANSNAFSGIYLTGTSPSSNTLTNNTANSNYIGINLESANNILTGNTMTGNIMANFYTDPLAETIDTTNLVESKPIYYLYGAAGNSYYNGQIYDGSTSNIGMFWCVNCVNVTLQNVTLASNNYHGVFFSNTVSSTIDHVTANSNYYTGIYLQSGSNGNTITNNTVKYNANQGGIYFNNSSNNTVSGNTVASNPGYGIYFTTTANNNTLTNNTISGNPKGNIRAVTTALINSIDTSNTVEGKPVYYLYGTAGNSYYSGQVYDGNVVGDIGMFWCLNCTNVTLKNATLSENNYDSIYFNNTGTSTIDNVVISGNFKYGIHFDNSSNNTISNNTIKSNFGYGVYLATSNTNTFSGNTFLNNINDIYNSGTTNTFTSNTFLNNIYNKALTITDIARTKNIGDTASTTITMYNLNGAACSSVTTPSCVATITTNPSETIFSTTTSNQIVASFSPSQSGMYSLNFVVSDSNGNATTRRLSFLVGATSTQTTRYYLRNILPIHGQPSGSDLRSLSLTAPTTTENWNCGNWVQNAPDEIPNYPLSSLSSIDIYSWYRQFSSSAGYIGAERFSTFANTANVTSSIAYAGDYTWNNVTLSNLNWQMDYPRSWYWLTLKVTGAANSTWPNWKTTASQPSYADMVYQYTITPAIKTISNDNIVILSATAPTSSTSSVVLVLDGSADSSLNGSGSTNITLSNFRRPFSGYTTDINADGTVILFATGITSTTSISSVPLDIIPNGGAVAVSNITWHNGDSGNYSKQWTESGASVASAEHTIGNLQANYYYDVKIDGTDYGRYLADESGQISFNYSGGYSTHIFTVDFAEPETTATATVNNNPYIFGDLTNNNVSVSLSCVDGLGANCINTFYCIDFANTCTPSIVYSGSIEVSGPANASYLRYYSVDSSGNNETVKSKIVNSIMPPRPSSSNDFNHANNKIDIKKTIVPEKKRVEKINIQDLIKLLILLKAQTQHVDNNGLNANSIDVRQEQKASVASSSALTLQFGMTNDDVSKLQTKLKSLGYFYHPYITKYFGLVTKRAVIKFQEDHGIVPAIGIYGPKTQAAMKELE